MRALPGVRAAAPLLEVSAKASGPRGSESVELVGADASLSALGGALVRHTSLEPFAGFGAIVLPAPLAHKIGVSEVRRRSTFELNGRVAKAALYEQLHATQIGPLISSPIAVAPLAFAQEMSRRRAGVAQPHPRRARPRPRTRGARRPRPARGCRPPERRAREL